MNERPEEIFTEEYVRAIEGYFARLTPEDVPSGVLHPPDFDVTPAERHSGSPDDAPLTRAMWRQIHFDLQRGARYGRGFTPLEELQESVQSFGDEIPIALLDLRYHTVRLTAKAHFLDVIRKRGTEAEPEPSRILEERRVFAAATLRHITARGESVTFRVAVPALLTNIEAPLESLEIDCGDGVGWRAVAAGETVHASYGETGEKLLRLRGRREGQTLETSFLFEVEQLNVPQYDKSWRILPDWPWEGKFAHGIAYIWYATGRTELARPLVISEGFDPKNEMTWDRLYAALGNLAKILRDGGYDLVIVDFDQGGDHIQRNGLLFASAIIQTVSQRIGKHPLTVLGVSMGGLVVRYALRALETRNIDHQVERYMSLDTPHSGANIQLGIQYFVDYFKEKNDTAKDIVDNVLNSPAARQMLRYHYDWSADEHVKADGMRAKFLADLAVIGDWPQKVKRKVAISNGRKDGGGQGPKDHEVLLKWSMTGAWGDLWFLPAYSTTAGELIFHGWYCGARIWQKWARSARPYDRAPGGYRNTNKQLADALAKQGTVRDYKWWHHCFVPTTSALAIDEAHLTDAIQDSWVTHFDDFFCTSNNIPHCEINHEIANFFMRELGIPAEAAEPRLPVKRSGDEEPIEEEEEAPPPVREPRPPEVSD